MNSILIWSNTRQKILTIDENRNYDEMQNILLQQIQNHLHQNAKKTNIDNDDNSDSDSDGDIEFDINKSMKMLSEIREEVNGVKKFKSSDSPHPAPQSSPTTQPSPSPLVQF
jgi:hypothetical protein